MKARSVSAALAGFMLVGVITAAPGSAAGGPVACPAPLPTKQAVDGLKGTGYTVERGTAPAPFSATVLGRITDGIAPGVDMIMAKLDSPAVKRAGIWKGMSGSPVYTKDGKLIGAVAYSMSLAPSPIAGITPASQMRDLLKLGTGAKTAEQGAADPAAAAGAERVGVPEAAAQRLAETGDVTQAQAGAGFVRLKVPVTVSGLGGASSQQAQEVLKQLSDDMPGAYPMLGASAAASGGSAAKISAGGNFTAAISYGDVTLAATGTTTFVCSGKAVAFGHPFLASGPSSMSVHPADAVYVQVDKTIGSFKVANPGGPVGTLDQDRTAGVLGRLGVKPKTAAIRSEISLVGGGSRVGTTQLVYQPYAAEVAGLHTSANIGSLLESGNGGSADIDLQIKGVRPNGQPFALAQNVKLASQSNIALEAAGFVNRTITSITHQPFEEVRITSVNITGKIDRTFRGYKVKSVQVKQDGKYVDSPSAVTAKGGSNLPIRVQLVPLGGGAGRTVDLALKVPPGTNAARVRVQTGQVFETSDMFSFDQVLEQLQAIPGAGALRAKLDVDDPADDSAKPVSATVSTDRWIADWEYSFEVSGTPVGRG